STRADDRLDHFESKIRPVLVKHCLECHGDDPEDLGGGLSLLSSAAILAGGDTGAAVVPGKPAHSPLLQAMRYEGEVKMPPEGRLPDQVIEDFSQWIEDGAVDPRADSAPPPKMVMAGPDPVEHWAFQPLSPPQHPVVSGQSTGLIDSWIDERLNRNHLRRSEPASPMTLLRRLHYDLTGLPPSAEMLRQHANHLAEVDYRRLVDKLLASDDFGRHWGRHWLDVARYADSNGSDFNATFHHAWRYRDYVIDSFAADKPYDRFVAEQIAGDLMFATTDQERAAQLIATGFLMLGPKMLSERDKAKLQMDVVDDQIDTIGRAMMGLTLGCARCHDHKFDPIPTTDYYALAGIFRSTDVLQGEIQKYVSDWIEVELPTDTLHVSKVRQFEQSEKQLAAKLKNAEARLKAAELRQQQSDSSIVVDDADAQHSGPWVESQYSRLFIGSGYRHDDNRNKGQSEITFKARLKPGRYRVSAAYSAAANRSRRTKVEFVCTTQPRTIELDQTKPPREAPWEPIGELTCEREEEVSVIIRNAATDGYVIADAIRFELADDKDLLAGDKVDPEAARRVADSLAPIQQEIDSIKKELAALRAAKPEPLPMAMAVRDAKQIGDTFVCVRGEVGLRGDTVTRGFLRVCQPESGAAAATATMPEDQSGRLQLAQWICDPDHPLTSRVIVNRVWMHLMGEGLVRTVDNFGTLGDRPSHPELLDALAVEFLRDGWSIKKLIRRIVTSETYRQSTQYNEQAMQIDAENRLLWRMNRKRIPAEALRDTLLTAAGELDPTPSIAPVSHFGTLVSANVANPETVKTGESFRRGVYLPVVRGQVNEWLAIFDFADPDLLVGKRERTNVPSQSLAMMNHPWVQSRARSIARELLLESADAAQVVEAAYLELFGRLPTQSESRSMVDFLRTPQESSVSEMVGAMVGSSEFRLLD
ncbi:MAG: DUF1553 domain-containing protein, partial [Planctomycetaceae bacterium]